MASSISKLIAESLVDQGLPHDHFHLMEAICHSPGCAKLRNRLLNEESPDDISHLLEGSFWEITPKYRFDVLALDLNKIGNFIVVSLGLSSIHLPHVVQHDAVPYIQTGDDRLFWYAIDNGFRGVASGWDRIALLLDLAFDLGRGKYCNLPSVLKVINESKMDSAGSQHLARLLDFVQGEFLELQGIERGTGVRHETTHLMTIWTRYTMEFLESQLPDRGHATTSPRDWHELLAKHYGHFIDGVQSAVGLIDDKFCAEDRVVPGAD